MANDHRRADRRMAQETLLDDPSSLKEILERLIQEQRFVTSIEADYKAASLSVLGLQDARTIVEVVLVFLSFRGHSRVTLLPPGERQDLITGYGHAG